MVWLFINKKIKMKNLNIKKYLNLLKKKLTSLNFNLLST